MKTNVATTSIETYHRAAKDLAKCEVAVYDDILAHPHSTRREIAHRVRMDASSVSGRVFTLREHGLIIESKTGRKCKHSGRRAKTLVAACQAQ